MKIVASLFFWAVFLVFSSTDVLGSEKRAPNNLNVDIISEQMKRVYKNSPSVVVIFTDKGMGTGFLFRNRDGSFEIGTNNHVVKNAVSVWIKFPNGKKFYEVPVIGRDPVLDIALLGAPSPIPRYVTPIKLGNSRKLEIGDRVYALGNPFGERSIAVGWINSLSSAVSRYSFSSQTPVHSGNSGGPMFKFNSKGEFEVIGINTSIISPSLSSGTLSFSIHINYFKRMLPRLRRERVVEHPAIGIHFEDIENIPPPLFEKIVNKSYSSSKHGVMITKVIAGMPGVQSGLAAGDLIVGMYSQERSIPFRNATDLVKRIFFGFRPGQKIVLKTDRDGQIFDRSITLTVFKIPSNDEEKQ